MKLMEQSEKKGTELLELAEAYERAEQGARQMRQEEEIHMVRDRRPVMYPQRHRPYNKGRFYSDERHEGHGGNLRKDGGWKHNRRADMPRHKASGGDRKPLTCYECGLPGHRQSQCDEKARRGTHKVTNPP